MTDIGKTISKAIFYLVALVLLLWTASLTVTFIKSSLPTLPWYVPYTALVAFDGGMIAWMYVFLKAAEGTIQRATALTATIFDFLGVGLMVIAEILLGGQTLTDAPETLGTWAIWGIGIWTVVNVLFVIIYHIGDPEAQKQMSIQNEKDAIWQGALKDLASRRTHNSAALAAQLGGRMYQEMLAELFVDRDGNGRPDLLEARNSSQSIVDMPPPQQPATKTPVKTPIMKRPRPGGFRPVPGRAFPRPKSEPVLQPATNDETHHVEFTTAEGQPWGYTVAGDLTAAKKAAGQTQRDAKAHSFVIKNGQGEIVWQQEKPAERPTQAGPSSGRQHM